MEFDTSDVEVPEPRRVRRNSTAIPLCEDDMLEAACEWRPRMAAGTARMDDVSDGVPLAIFDDCAIG